jgi:uncharacterized protein YqeY
MKGRAGVAVSALRSAIAAIDNAGAVDAPDAKATGRGVIAGAMRGVGASEVPRRELSETEVASLVRHEIAQREEAAAEYERLRRDDEAARLRAEIAVLAAQLGDRDAAIDK